MDTRTIAPSKPAHEPLEAIEPVEVEVVRRLVEAEHVEAREQQRRERHARRLAAGERRQLGVERHRDTELRADLPRARLEICAAEREELVRARRDVAPLHPRFRVRDARAPREEAEQRLTLPPLRLLRQVTDGADALDASGRRLVDAGEDAQQRRLAAAVRPHDADARAGRNGERDAVENDRRAVLLRDVRRDNAAAAHARDLLIERKRAGVRSRDLS